ncbi:LOW QUALITY PROTEIN: F-box associated domain, type [Trema orientale]|uniref:F-box associated domain, type n=1 Tax=Trema orientale TaxID=63057 RepID=A0A2P5BTJ1_TREOI|nr:LOW QUALITY PROTEIN: F-box associated domain, type [Trema orientale]
MLTLVNADIDDDPLREGESDYIPCVTENLNYFIESGYWGIQDSSEICLDDSETDTRVVGFGYDPRSDDYKFVITKSLEVFEPGPYIAEIFTLSTNSWEEIEFDLDVHIPNCDYQVVYCNGFCYWYFWDWECTIVSFDIGDEVFQIIPGPKDVPMMPGEWEVITEWTKIAVWNDSLVLFFYTKLDPIVIDMWVMNACSDGVQVFQIIPLPEDVPVIPEQWEEIGEWTKIAVWNESLVLFFHTRVDPIVIDMWAMGYGGRSEWF